MRQCWWIKCGGYLSVSNQFLWFFPQTGYFVKLVWTSEWIIWTNDNKKTITKLCWRLIIFQCSMRLSRGESNVGVTLQFQTNSGGFVSQTGSVVKLVKTSEWILWKNEIILWLRKGFRKSLSFSPVTTSRNLFCNQTLCSKKHFRNRKLNCVGVQDTSVSWGSVGE